MKLGIDSYCYHRFFGEVYPQQRPPSLRMTMEDFVSRACELGVVGVSLESCFFPSFSSEYLSGLKKSLDEHGLDRVYAWGHPDGLEGGRNQEAYEDMILNLDYARQIGAKVMRVVGSSLVFRNDPHQPQLERLTRMFREAARVAEEYGIKLAVENHIDFNADEMVQLLEAVDSPYLGINFDTGNFVRLLDDPVKGMAKLASRVYATHIKDLQVQKRVPADEWFFFSSVPAGDGIVDIAKLVEILTASGFDGILAVEIDFLHPSYGDDEDAAVAKSITKLKSMIRT
ncbi:MAG TPA: sugar phosphate isomerase/epimerase family protein [Terriglobia bacterium]|nr:sugar phosphate isomerase/epimerase family protein [Terriglobia bacterium]